MADEQTIPMTTAGDPPPLPPSAPGDLPPPPSKETFSDFHRQRQASELRRLYRHIHPELRKNLAEAVAEDLAEVLGSEEPTEGDVQCMRWIFENWRLDAIGDREKPAAKEPVPGGDVQATSRKFEEGSLSSSMDQEPADPQAIPRGDVRTARWLFETKPLGELTGQDGPPGATVREPAASGDVQGTRMLFETRPLDRLGSRPSIQEQSPLELRSEIQELKGDVKKTVKLFQTEPLCAIQDAEGAIHEVKAACREEIHSNAVRSARWLFETRPLDAINQDPSQVRVIRGISLEEGARPDVSAARWIFETQPLDAIREIVVDEKDFQPSPDLVPPGPDVQQQRHLFETRALDTLKGEEEEAGAETPAKEKAVPGDVRSTLWLFETQPLDTLTDKVQVGHLQRVGPQEAAGLQCERLSSSGHSALALSPSGPETEGLKGDVKTFKNLFETLPLDSIGQGEHLATSRTGRAEGTDSGGQPQDAGSPLYAMQDSKGHLHALTSVSREQVVGGDVQGYRWMFETQPLDQLGRHPSTVDVVRGITRQEVVAGDVGTARWLFETQPLEVIHQRERQERQEEEGKGQGGTQPGGPMKGDVQTMRWLFETCPMSELADRWGSEASDLTAEPKVQSCTWMFDPQALDRSTGSGEQHLRVGQVQAGDRQTDGHVFETEPLQASGRPCRRGPVRYCSRVEIPSGQVSRQKEVFQALEVGKQGDQWSRAAPGPAPGGAVHKFTWLFENCPIGSLAAESIGGDNVQEEQPLGPPGHGVPKRQHTAAEGTLQVLHATPGILHRGGILMEARGPGELCLARYVLPGPAQGPPNIQKEELVSGELPRIVQHMLRRPDMDPQGLLVQEDPAGQLQLTPLRLPAPGSSGGVGNLDPEFQQVLACSLKASVARIGLVMQETEQGLVALTVYSLQPRPASRASEKGSVQLLAGCINKGDLSGLQSLRWEPPADSTPAPGSEGGPRPPLTDRIIHVPLLDPSLGTGHLRGPGLTACSPPPAGKTVPLAGDTAAPACSQGVEKPEISHPEQKGTATWRKLEGATAARQGPGGPDPQAAMQGLQMAAAEAQSPHRQVLAKHKQDVGPTATSAHLHNRLQAPATAPRAAQSTRPAARGDPRIPGAPRKVSGEDSTPHGGLPGGWGTVHDGVYTAHPIRTFEPLEGAQLSEREPHPRDKEATLPAEAPSPLQRRQDQSLRPGQEGPGDQTQSVWGPPGKAVAEVSLGGLQMAETILKAVPSGHHTPGPGAQAADASLHSHNASVPPPPPLPAAVMGPDFPARTHHREDSIQQGSAPLWDSLTHPSSSPAGQTSPVGSETETLKWEPSTPPRNKPPLPPKPAHLSLTHPPRRFPKPPALSPRASLDMRPGEQKQGETDAAILKTVKVPTVVEQPGPQHGLSTVAPRLTESQALRINAQNPESPKLKAPSSGPTSPQWGPRPTESQALGINAQSPESSKLKAPSSDPASLQHSSSLPGEPPETLPGGRQQLQGLLRQVQALEAEAMSSVDVRALRRLFEAVPQLEGGAPQLPAACRKRKASVEQAFGELTRVSTEVARLREQTLARLMDIEDAVSKALSSMCSLQPEASAQGHSQWPPKDSSTHKASVTGSCRTGPNWSVQEARSQTGVKSPAEAGDQPVVEHQGKVGGHTEVRGQAASTDPPIGRLEALREDTSPPQILSPCRDLAPSPTFISIPSATRKPPEAPNPTGSPDITRKSIHLVQDAFHQEDAQEEASRKEVTHCSGLLESVPASGRPLPPGQQKGALELQTSLGGSQHYQAMGTMTRQHQETDQLGNTIPESITVTRQGGPPGGPGSQHGLYASPLLRQFLHTPAGLGSTLADPGLVPVPCGHSQPGAP